MIQGKAICRWSWLSLHAGRWSGRAIGDAEQVTDLSEAQVKPLHGVGPKATTAASPRACRQGLSFADEQSRNAQIFVFTHEARDPWERLGGTAFPPSPNDSTAYS